MEGSREGTAGCVVHVDSYVVGGCNVVATQCRRQLGGATGATGAVCPGPQCKGPPNSPCLFK